MHGGMRRSGRALGWRLRVIAVAGMAAIALGAIGVGSASAKKSGTVWLCRPGKAADPCTSKLTSTVVTYTAGHREETVEKAKKAKNPPIDCFYVYPTVSEQETTNSNLEIEPQERQIAIDQASRFSQDCKVYAPMYPQVTLKAINNPNGVPPEASAKAYVGVLTAFEEYMAKYNDGRGVVLIGHSQGSLMLIQLLREQFDGNEALRHQLVSAVLLGGNVLVPSGQRVGGEFQNIPLCNAAYETHCIIAYSSFLKEPPEGAFFGRPNSPLLGSGVPKESESGLQVACVNPALLTQTGQAAALRPYASTTPFPGVLGQFSPAPSAPTPWVATPGLYTGQCKHENGASWLQISLAGSPSEMELKEREEHNELAEELLGPNWGLHLYDVNIALGNLVSTVAEQSQSYGFEG
jgi:DUF3089 family protein